MNLPFVSIIINNYNYGRFLESAIDSALRQTYPHVEIIVVDDGSIDDSRKIIASYANKVLPVLKPNGGQASAFNAGFAASRGEIICFLDADDLMLPQRIETVVHILTTQPDLMWGYHQVRQIDAAGNPIGDAPRPNETEQVFRFDVRDEIEQGFLRQLPLPLPGTSGFCFRRSHLQKILPMPEAEGVALNDSYLQFASCALSRGFASTATPIAQRIHAHNHFTQRSDNQRLGARILILTAYWLRVNFPFIYRFTNKLLAQGMGTYWKAGGVSPDSRSSVDLYLSETILPQRIEITGRAIYHYLKAHL